MKYCELLGTYNGVDWNALIDSLGPPEQIHQPGTTNWPAWEAMEEDGNEMSVVFRNWKDANFNMDAIKWSNYYPGTGFPWEVAEKVAEHVGLNGIHRAWISRLDPGCMAPWHFDGDDKVASYLEKGEVKRYVCTMSKPVHGHIFILGEDDYFCSSPQGTLFKWNYFREWHGGINAGLTPKYQFHLIGY
jgi:hypothetical protein